MQPTSQSVFVSYSRDDEQFVLSFANQLRTRGVDIWLEQWAIPKGGDWDRAIEDALTRCACLLIILSSNSVASDEVRSELRTALDSAKPIVPVLLQPCPIPRRLRLIQHVDISTHPEASENVDRVVEALQGAMAGSGRVESEDFENSPEPRKVPILEKLFGGRLQRTGATESKDGPTFIGKLRRWGKDNPAYLFALGVPYLAFATWHLFRLPVPAEDLPLLIFSGTSLMCLLALWLGSRLGTSILAACIGGVFALKPLLVPFEGFSYSSETAMNYWVPGIGFLVAAVGLVLTSTRTRLALDLRHLRPPVGAILIAALLSLTAYAFFSRPTVHDIYEPFRPRYGQLREHLRTIASALDSARPPFPAARPLDIPLVLDESSRVREEDDSTTGHILLYQQLTDPDTYFGDIEYLFRDDLHLHIRDTGTEPVLYGPGFAKFVNKNDARSLEHTLNAPYLVVVKPLSLKRSGRVDNPDLATAGPYRVFLYHLKRDEILWVGDVENPGSSGSELQEAVYSALERSVGAKILR